MEIKRTGIILEIQDDWNVGKFLSAVKHKETTTIMLHVPIKHVPISSLQLVYIILQVSPLMFIPLQCIHLNSKSIHTTMKIFQSENSGFMQFLHLTCPYPPLCLFTCVKESHVQFKMRPLWRGRKKMAGQGRASSGQVLSSHGIHQESPHSYSWKTCECFS